MAYRRPTNDHRDLRHRRQTRIARWTGAVLAWGFVLLLAIAGERLAPPQLAPWKPLSLADPVGFATAGKLRSIDPAQCRAVLAQGGATWVEAPETTEDFCTQYDVVRLTSGTVPLKPRDAAMTCREALAFTLWERQVVQPAAFELLGQGVTGVEHFGTYACRRQYGSGDLAAPVSEHAFADAIDVAAFDLADGTRVSVLDDWADPGPKGAFLHRVRDGACGVFSTTLSPDYNAAHANHLHLDMAKSWSGFCPRVAPLPPTTPAP